MASSPAGTPTTTCAAPPPPPARPLPPYNAWELALVSEIAALRRDPPAYARLLETERKPHYRGRDLVMKGARKRDDVIIETHEGVAACDEAIAALRATKPLLPLRLDPGLSIAAKAVVNVCGPAGSIDTDAVVKMREYGRLEPGGTAVEVSAYGGKDARAMVMGLLISDGDPERSQRRDLLDAQWTAMGVAVGKHATSYERTALLLFATLYTDKPEVAQNLGKYQHLWSINEP